MRLTRFLGTAVVLGAIIAGLVAVTPRAAHGTDLLDSTTLVAHPAADINDVYMFPSPSNPANVVLVMDVDAGNTAATASALSFDPAVLYQFKISHTASAGLASGQGKEDTVIQFLASGSGSGQSLTMFGPASPNQIGSVSTVVANTSSTTIPFSRSTTLTVGDDKIPAGTAVPVSAYAGLIGDPAYFDLTRFFALNPDRNASNHTTGQTIPSASATSFAGFSAAPCDTAAATNYFQGRKTLAIIVELPKSVLEQVPGQAASAAQPYVHLWATTSTMTGS